MDSWSFDVFQVNEVGDGHALKHIGYELLQKYDIISRFKVGYPTECRILVSWFIMYYLLL